MASARAAIWRAFWAMAAAILGSRAALRLAIYAEDLLLRRVRPASEVTRFGRGRPIAGAEDAGDVDPLAAEELEEFAAAFVVADHAYWDDARA